MPIVLIALFTVLGFIHPWIPLPLQSSLYALSLSLKSIIIFLIPFVIFALLFKTTINLAKQASRWVLLIIIAVCASNFLSTLFSYTIGQGVYLFDLSFSAINPEQELTPLWNYSLPKLFDNSYALLAGLLFGIASSWLFPKIGNRLLTPLDQFLKYSLKFLGIIVPLFLIGFMVKMLHEGTFLVMVKQYSAIFACIALSVFAYLIVLYIFASKLRNTSWKDSIKNMLPAAIAGFGSMSSVAAMPLTLKGTEKNGGAASGVIPLTVNIHLIGDCFAIPIFAFAILKSFGIADPSFVSYLLFSFYFVLAKFSVAAVPGGGIIVMLPILESYLGLQGEMLSLITALYIIFDPLITSANVFGNGAFALITDALIKRKKIS